MSISIKTAREIEKMRRAGELLEKVHDELGRAIHPGMSTWEINKLGEEMIRSFGCTPNFLNYNGYPASICVSVNEEVVHGIPSKKRILKEGDIVSLDAGLIYEGYHSDAARTHAVGEISPEARKLVEVTRQAFFEGIKYAKAGHHLHEISAAIGAYYATGKPTACICGDERGYGVVRDLCGHGIGTALHEAPEIPNYEVGRKGVRLRPGMTLAIEPMITAGGYAVRWLDDDWTVVTEDGSLAAHYENTILITEGEPEILTLSHTEEDL
jgi:methionyl aminopeptidase